MTAILYIPEVVCTDADTYECTAVSDNSQKAVMVLNVTSKYFYVVGFTFSLLFISDNLNLKGLNVSLPKNREKLTKKRQNTLS